MKAHSHWQNIVTCISSTNEPGQVWAGDLKHSQQGFPCHSLDLVTVHTEKTNKLAFALAYFSCNYVTTNVISKKFGPPRGTSGCCYWVSKWSAFSVRRMKNITTFSTQLHTPFSFFSLLSEFFPAPDHAKNKGDKIPADKISCLSS